LQERFHKILVFKRIIFTYINIFGKLRFSLKKKIYKKYLLVLGYRTNSSTGSPSSSIHSPSPGTGERKGELGEVQREDEEGNLMWLVDFKLDFFNDIEKNAERGKIFN